MPTISSRKAKQRKKNVISKEKACKILHDGKVRGEELSDKARRFMAARCDDASR